MSVQKVCKKAFHPDALAARAGLQGKTDCRETSIVHSWRTPFRLTTVLLLALLSMSGCDHNPLDQVEQKIRYYNYADALNLLDNVDTAKVEAERYHLLRAQSFLVEGDFQNGFRETEYIEAQHINDQKKRYVSAKVMLKAAEVMIREKDRARETIMLFDSALVRDPTLERVVLQICWDRAIEYLNVSGPAAFLLLNYSIQKDEKTLGRLRGFNVNFARQYEEMVDVDSKLERIYMKFSRFQSSRKRQPKSLQDLAQYSRLQPADTLHQGWSFKLMTIDDTLRVVAAASTKNPLKFPVGTTMQKP